MSGLYVIVVVFIVPFALALYLWRDTEPQRAIYFMCLSVSTLALIILLLGTDAMAAIMPLGLFLASTSFFAGVFLSGLVRAYRKRED